MFAQEPSTPTEEDSDENLLMGDEDLEFLDQLEKQDKDRWEEFSASLQVYQLLL